MSFCRCRIQCICFVQAAARERLVGGGGAQRSVSRVSTPYLPPSPPKKSATPIEPDLEDTHFAFPRLNLPLPFQWETRYSHDGHMPKLHNLFLEQKPPSHLATLNGHLSADGVTPSPSVEPTSHSPPIHSREPRSHSPPQAPPDQLFRFCTHQGLRLTSHQLQYRDESTSKYNGRVA